MQTFLAPSLSEQEKQTLYDNRNSELYRVFAKAVTYMYSIKAAELAHAQPQDLVRYQGIMQGLLIAKNILSLGQMPEAAKK